MDEEPSLNSINKNITALAQLNVYSASAGSGKTYTLARTVIDILARNPLSYDHILAVTFTNKATAEMKERIVGDLHLMVSGDADDKKRRDLIDHHVKSTGLDEKTLIERCQIALRGILYDYGRFSVSTIDRFVQRVLRAFAYEQGLTANYALSLENDEIVQAAMTDMMESLAEHEELCAHLVKMAQDKLEEENGWSIEKEIKKMGMLLLDNDRDNLADSGAMTIGDIDLLKKELGAKERNLFMRIYDLAAELASERKRCAITDVHKRNYPQDMLDAMPANNLSQGETGFPSGFRKWAEDAKDKLLKLNEKLVNKKSQGLVAEFVAKMESIKDETSNIVHELNSITAIRKNLNTIAVMGDLAQHISSVEERENRHSLSTSGDMLRELIDDCPVPFIYEKCGARYDTIMIDEFQDTSHTQYENFDPLLRNSLAEGHDCLIVGDVKQSIYRFRQGDWRLLGQRVAADFPETNYKPLSDNYRSLKEIVTFNNTIFAKLPAVMDEDVATQADPSDTMVAMYADSQQTPHKPAGGYASIRIFKAGKDNSQATREYANKQFIEALRMFHDEKGYPYSDICVLVRKKTDGEKVIEQLGNEGIPVMSEDSLLVMNSYATQFMSDAMRYVSTGEQVPLFAAVRSLTGSDVADLTRKWDAERETWAGKFDELRGLGLVEMGGELINMMPEAMRNEQMPYIDAFMQNMRDEICNGITTLDAFLKTVEDNEGKWILSAASGEDAVRIMTIHKSKGLEFKVVLIPYTDWSIKNHTNPSTIWVPIDRLGLEGEAWKGRMFPVKHDAKTLDNSLFSPESAAETRAIYEDNINTIYVAFTRPTDALMVWGVYTISGSMADKLGKAVVIADETVDGLVKKVENIANEPITMPDGTEDSVSADVYSLEIGTPPSYHDKKPEPLPSIDVPMAHAYRPSSSPAINTQVEMGEYERRADMVSYGLTMHGILESVTTMTDLPNAISHAVTCGLVLPFDATKLEEELNRRLTAPTIAPWFDGSMTDVWAETTMIGPDRRLRPDRIMRSPSGETVIVDYKFGRAERPEHIEQVRQYMAWLSDAEFPNIKAYLWYYTLGKVVEVEREK